MLYFLSLKFLFFLRVELFFFVLPYSYTERIDACHFLDVVFYFNLLLLFFHLPLSLLGLLVFLIERRRHAENAVAQRWRAVFFFLLLDVDDDRLNDDEC